MITEGQERHYRSNGHDADNAVYLHALEARNGQITAYERRLQAIRVVADAARNMNWLDMRRQLEHIAELAGDVEVSDE